MSEEERGQVADDRPSSILFVCTGNICRSPMGERILRQAVDSAVGVRSSPASSMSGNGVAVSSAGVGAHNGQPMHPFSIEVLDEHGYDGTDFEARYLRPQMLGDVDLVLTMTREHRAACQQMLPARWKRMFTLAEFLELARELDGPGLSTMIDSRARIDTNSTALDIVDPMGQPKAAFERVFAELEPRVEALAQWLIGDPTGVTSARWGPLAAEEITGSVDESTDHRPETAGSQDAGSVPPVSTPPVAEPASGPSASEPPASTGRRRALWLVVGVVVLILIGVGWLVYAAIAVKGDLESARTDAQRARTLILDGDQQGGAQRAAQSAADKARSASTRTHGIVWSAAAAIPWLGEPFDSVSHISDTVSDYASQVLVPAADLSSVLDPAKLRSGDAINTTPLREAEPQLAVIAAKSHALADRAAGIAPSWWGTVADARQQLADMIERANATVQGTSVAAQLIPSMLGADSPRHYLLAMQTPSESRGTGGLVGGFAVINADRGRVTVPTLGTNAEFRDPAVPQLDLGPDFDLLYGPFQPYTDFRNGNLSANFPDAAQIWMANWRAQTGQQLDGAIALDPIAMSYLLKVTGPVTLPGGEKITAENIAPITLSTSYQRFADDNTARKKYLQSISRAVIDQVSGFRGDTGALLEALGRGVHERRIMVYSNDSHEEQILQTTNLGHQISDTSAPYLQVVLTNAGGNKLDYYLRREISYQAAGCSAGTRESRVTVKLTNTLDNLSLPDYVIAPNGTNLSVERGTNLVNVALLTTKGATVTSLQVDDAGPLYVNQTFAGRPYVSTMVRVPPGQTVTVVLTLQEPTSAHGAAQVPIQPLADQPKVTVDVPNCR